MSADQIEPKKNTLRILITGGTGFVGANLTRKLVQRGHEVHLLCRATSDLWRLNGLENEINFHYIDLREQAKLQDLLKQLQPDRLCHLATYGGFHHQQNLNEIVATNLNGTTNLLLAATHAECPFVILTGSSSEYGFKNTPMCETDVLAPVTIYGATKAASTLIGQAYNNSINSPLITSLRIFSPYGPYDDPSRFLASALTAAMLNKSIPLTEGNQKRDYIYIDDVVAAYLKLIDEPTRGGGIYNIGSGVETSLREAGAIIEQVCQKTNFLHWGALTQRGEETPRWVASLEISKAKLEWQPQTDLLSGIKQSYDWLKRQYHLHQRYASILVK